MARSIHPWLGKARSSRAPRFENTCDQDGSIFPIGGQVSECTYPRSHRGSTRERVGLRNEIEAKGKGDGVERVAGPSSPSSSSLRRETKLRRRVPRLNVTVSVEEGLLPFEEDRIERYGQHLYVYTLIDAISSRIRETSLRTNIIRARISDLKIG